MITRKKHAFEGLQLIVIGLTRRGVSLLLVVLPDGSRSLIPVAWTDWMADNGATVSSSPRDGSAGSNLGTIADLVKVRVVVDDLLRRHTESASCQEGGHAVEARLSRPSRDQRMRRPRPIDFSVAAI